MRGLCRLVLLLLLAGSAVLTWRAAAMIATDPMLSPLVERGRDEIVAATDRMMAREATAELLAERLATRLAEDPRNWIALEALAGVHAERDLPLPDAYAEAFAQDSGVLANVAACAACVWDIAACSLSTALICKAPILLTPVEDLRGITKAGVDYASGNEIDRLDLGLSVVGLSSTALVVVSGGTSATLKAGTALIKLARGMRLLSPRLTARLGAALADGIRWADIPAVRSLDDVTALMRAEALAPVTATLAALGRTEAVLGPARTLHLLPLVDDATDARRLAQVSEALGPRTIGRAEMLGKARLFRAGLRVSGTAVELVVGLVGVLLGLGTALAHLVQTLVLRHLRRTTRVGQPPRR